MNTDVRNAAMFSNSLHTKYCRTRHHYVRYVTPGPNVYRPYAAVSSLKGPDFMKLIIKGRTEAMTRKPEEYYRLKNGLIVYHMLNDENGEMYCIITRKITDDYTLFTVGDNLSLPQEGSGSIYGPGYDIDQHLNYKDLVNRINHNIRAFDYE